MFSGIILFVFCTAIVIASFLIPITEKCDKCGLTVKDPPICPKGHLNL